MGESMNIETYVIAWNRADTIHMTVNYYKQFGRVILYDNFSEDNTREIAESCGAEIQLFGNRGVLSDQHYLDVKNHCWKGSKADWVIVVDDDEILTVMDNVSMEDIFWDAKIHGHTIFKPQGYSMYSNDMPLNSWFDIKTGIIDDKYSKLACFNPKSIESINYIFGCHEANPKGNIVYNNDLSLLHYNAVGGAERMIKRHQLYEPRRQKSPVNMRWGLGKEYGYSPESKRIWFKEQLAKSEILF